MSTSMLYTAQDVLWPTSGLISYISYGGLDSCQKGRI